MQRRTSSIREAVSLGVDTEKLERYLRGDRHTDVTANASTVARAAPIRALVVMHVFGHPADLDALARVTRDWNITLIEDAAESLGSSYGSRHTGNVGLVSALSFNGNKIVTTGGGGAVLTNDAVLGPRAKHLTTTARVAASLEFHPRRGGL